MYCWRGVPVTDVLFEVCPYYRCTVWGVSMSQMYQFRCAHVTDVLFEVCLCYICTVWGVPMLTMTVPLLLFTLCLTGSFSGGGGAWWNPRPDGVHGEWHQLAQASFAHSVYIAYQHFCSEIQTKLSNTLLLFDLWAGFQVICTTWSLAVSWCRCRYCHSWPSWTEFSCVVVVSCSMLSSSTIIFHGSIAHKTRRLTHTGVQGNSSLCQGLAHCSCVC